MSLMSDQCLWSLWLRRAKRSLETRAENMKFCKYYVNVTF